MSTGDYRVADISLADFGRKEIELAEHEVSFLINRIALVGQYFGDFGCNLIVIFP